MPDDRADENAAIATRIENCAAFHLRRIARAATRHYDECLRPVGIRITQFTLLNILRLYPKMTVQKLADATLIERTTLSRNIKTMQREGWVAVEPDSRDRRFTTLTVTKAGMAKFNEALPFWLDAQTFVEEQLGATGYESLRENLDRASTVFSDN